jgi:hypothetical protein
MKELVEAIAKALKHLNCQGLSSELQRVANALAQSKVKKIDAISKALSRISHTNEAPAGTKLGSLSRALTAFYDVLLVASAKKKSVGDLKALLDLFDEYAQLSTDEFCKALCPTTTEEPAVDRQLVETYLQKLETALGDEQTFPSIYKALTSDKRINQPEAVELASRFLAPLAKSTSRPKALRQVLYRHEKLLESRAASASIAAPR